MKKSLLLILALLALPAMAQTVQFKSPNVAITGGTVTGITTLGARSSGAAFDLQLGSDEVLTASRLLKINVANAARTLTIPGSTTVPIVSQTLTIAGPTQARTITLPDAAITVARTDAGQTFIGTQAFGALTATTVNGHTFTAGSSTFTGTAAQVYTFPTTTASLARTDAAQTFTGVQTLAELVVSTTASPAAADACTAGKITWDTGFIYVCTATGVWKRAALTGGY